MAPKTVPTILIFSVSVKGFNIEEKYEKSGGKNSLKREKKREKPLKTLPILKDVIMSDKKVKRIRKKTTNKALLLFSYTTFLLGKTIFLSLNNRVYIFIISLLQRQQLALFCQRSLHSYHKRLSRFSYQ